MCIKPDITELVWGPTTLRDFIASRKYENHDILLTLLDQNPLSKKTQTDSTLYVKEESSIMLKGAPSGREERTMEQVAFSIRSALGNPLFTFALGILLTYFIIALGNQSYLSSSAEKNSGRGN
ncbi:hypothetical protein F4825DRAFT_455602 [Nemania diffusa]|nr:hypothetical protein F4825DRAFT_455602 [Nemania diffusa]